MARHIDFLVADKTVTATTDGSLLVGGTREHYYARATFDEEWRGLAVRVTWTNGAASVTQDWADGMEVPPECCAPGAMRASFVGVGADGVETIRTARMGSPVAFADPGDDLGDEAAEQAEDVVHAAQRELSELSQAVGDAQATVAAAEKAVADCGEATESADKATKAATEAAGLATEAAGKADASATEAARVNAVLSGTRLTVTDREGASVTSDVQGPRGEAGQDADIAAADEATKAATEAAASATESAEKADAAALRANAAAGAALQGLTWAKVSELVKSGDAPAVFPIGSQFTTRLEGNGYEVEAFAWDVVHHFDGSDAAHPLVTLSDGTQAKGMMLQAHRTVPWAIVWEPEQAAIAVTGDMPAGTYHFTVKVTAGWGTGVAGAVGETAYQFTTTKALAAGAQLAWDGSYSTAPSKLTAYAGPTSTTAIETCAVTQGSGGTDLGVMTDETASTNSQSYAVLNNVERACYGSNRWKTSQIRAALDATGAIEQGGDAFSRPWGLVGKTGLLGCLPEDFVGVLGEVERKQELHPWDGGAVEATYDRMFPVSAREHGFSSYLSATASGFEAEGVPLDYWTQLRAASGRAAWGGWQAYPELITYDAVATTTSRRVWSRSAYRHASTAYEPGGVYISGGVGVLTASSGDFAAPACLIV